VTLLLRGIDTSIPMVPPNMLVVMAGKGFMILPSLTTTTPTLKAVPLKPTNKLLIVTTLPTVVHIPEADAPSTVADKQLTVPNTY